MTTSLPRATSANPAPASPSVLAVVVTHDGRTWLRDCLVSLANQSYETLDVLVVDDASPNPREEPQLKRIAKRHLRRRRWGFLRTPRSLGYGAAINWALSRVRTDADLLLFIHDDAALTPDSVKLMVERIASDESIAIVGPKVVLWDDPSVLEEVGMAVDRFGYPYKGLEEGEIDLGQHDIPSEVFYVTSTCMLMRHDVFRGVRGWDARLGAYAEDLDLCWRTRLTGRSVRIEPGAVARHVIAMATDQRQSRFRPSRYYIRRNRLRTIAKNASALRLLLLLPQFVLLTFAEMLGFLILRQPREVGGLIKALLWNGFRAPQTLAERTRVQRSRRVSDNDLRRFMVRETTRMRVYLALQRDRLEEAWGRRAEVVAQRTKQARALSQGLRATQVAVVLLIAVGLALGFRNFIWAPAVSVGELLPFPERATSLWRVWASPWQGAGLGAPGGSPPSMLLLGIFPMVTLGAVGLAQKLLIGFLGLGAGLGAYRLVREVVDRPARFVTALVYVLGAIGYSGMRAGALSALVFGAAAPFALHAMLRLSGWMRPPRWSASREIARLVLFAAISAAFVPGSLFLYAIAALLLSLSRTLMGRAGIGEMRAVSGSLIGLAGAWLLLLPWSATWFSVGGALDVLGSDGGREVFVRAFADGGMGAALLGQMPQGLALSGLALPVLGVIAVLAGGAQRRRMALALWTIVITIGWLATLIAKGVVGPLVASPIELGVLASAAYAGLAGLAVAAFRLDLPRRGLGVVHAVTLGGLAIAGLLLVAGVAPELWHGGWGPGEGYDVATPDTIEQIDSLLAAEATESGQFRALWIGSRWRPPEPSVARPPGPHQVTDARGEVIADIFARGDTPGEAALDEVVRSVDSGSTDRGGRLLGSFNIRYVILERRDATSPWLEQRDLALVRTEPDYYVLEFTSPLQRASLYSELPTYVRALNAADPSLVAGSAEVQRGQATQTSTSTFELRHASGPGVVFVAESADGAWTASVGDRRLERVDGGWANAWDVPAGAEGDLHVSYPRSASRAALLAAVVIAWVFMVGAAFPRRAPARRTGSQRR